MFELVRRHNNVEFRFCIVGARNVGFVNYILDETVSLYVYFGVKINLLFNMPK